MLVLFESIGQDVRYALRMMRSSIGLTIIAILSLALGIGATTAIFSLVNALMLKPLPVREPGRLVEVARSDVPNVYTYLIWKQIQKQQDIFSGVFTYGYNKFDLAENGEKHSVWGLYVSGDYFNTLGVPAALGRTLAQSDDQPGLAPVCMISYGLWQRRYGESRSAVGRKLLLEGQACEIVGVAPRKFFGVEVGRTFEVMVPLESERVLEAKRPALDDAHEWWLSVVGRLKPGVSVSQADARLRILGPAVFKASLPPGEDEKNWRSLLQLTLDARPMRNGISYTRYVYGNTVLLLMVLVGVVLILACTNLANLLLARSTRRQGEIATRLALGASRWRLIRQLLTESMTLSLAGTMLGIFAARWGSRLLAAAISFNSEPSFLDFSWDSRLVAFTLATTLLCALLFGLAPALGTTRVPLYSAMKNGPILGRGKSWFSGAVLIVTQVSLSIVLLVTAGLLIRNLKALLAKDPGYEAKGVLVVEVESQGSDDDVERQAFVGDNLLTEMRSVPSVLSAARFVAPTSTSVNPNIVIQNPGSTERHLRSLCFFVSPDFFRTRHSPMLAGRDFNQEDRRTSSAVAIVSERAAKIFFPGLNPIGLKYKSIEGSSRVEEESVEIVGVVKDIDFRRPDAGPLNVVYRPIAQCMASCAPFGRYELRFNGPSSEIRERVRTLAAGLDSHVALNFGLLTDAFSEGIQRDRVTSTIATLIGLLAGALAVIGIYGVTSYATLQRTREIGVRMALGALPGAVFRMIVGDAITIVLVGIGLGVVAGYGTAQTIRGMLFGVTPADPITFTLVSFLMLFVAVIAAFLPAYRASKADPIISLRVE